MDGWFNLNIGTHAIVLKAGDKISIPPTINSSSCPPGLAIATAGGDTDVEPTGF